MDLQPTIATVIDLRFIVVRYLERLAASITAMIYNSLEFFLTSSLFV
jgi:hypothetical protein